MIVAIAAIIIIILATGLAVAARVAIFFTKDNNNSNSPVSASALVTSSDAKYFLPSSSRSSSISGEDLSTVMGIEPNRTFYQQGAVTSGRDTFPGHYKEQTAMLLPPRPDGQTYSGLLTFTASKKVEVEVLQTLTENLSKFGP